jgi:uncharacterized protein (TIGR03435 family)
MKLAEGALAKVRDVTGILRTSHARSTTRVALAALLFAFATIPASGQTSTQPAASPAADHPVVQTEFEVASVRMVEAHPIDDLRRGVGLAAFSTYPANRFFMHNVTFKNIIATAFGIDPDRISSGLDWPDSQMYDIDAKVPGSDRLTYEQIKPLLKKLVQDRFGLTFHRETRTVSGYALVIAKGAPKLQPAKPDEDSSGYLVPNGLKMQNMSLEALATWLARPAGRPVADQTGIKGNFDFKLDYANMNDANSSLPDIFTALQEQLGLKLIPQKIPIEIFVIDHADRIPTEN